MPRRATYLTQLSMAKEMTHAVGLIKSDALEASPRLWVLFLKRLLPSLAILIPDYMSVAQCSKSVTQAIQAHMMRETSFMVVTRATSSWLDFFAAEIAT